MGQRCTGKYLMVSNVALEVPDNNAHEKILFNDVLILLGQHCTGKNIVKFCPRSSRKQCTGKNSNQCGLNSNILGTTLYS